MKRLSLILLISSMVITSAFSKNFFEKRYVEMQISAPVSLSNNVLALEDVLKKDLVIDLKDLASKVPNNGMVFNAAIAPSYAIHVQFGNVFVGLTAGVDAYERLSISDDLFDFLGNGCQVGQVMDVALNNSADVFSYTEFDFGLKKRKYSFHVKPALFVPIASMSDDIGHVSVVNNSEGEIIANLQANVKVHTLFDFNDPSTISSEVGRSMGFDLAGSYTRILGRKTSFEIDARIPIVPGKLNYLSNYNLSYNYSMKVTDFGNADNSSATETQSGPSDTYYITRPLKLTGYFDYAILGKMFGVRVGAGLGVYHPFVNGMAFFPEYYLGATFNLADVFKIALSTEYTDRVFKNQAGITLNLRVIQLDTGVSVQAATFTKSFTGTGYGAYAMFTIGY